MSKTLIFFLLPFCFVACEKEEPQIENYRDKYVGDYTFQITYTYPVGYWVEEIQGNAYTWKDTTYYYSGSIKKSTTFDRILVDWGNDTLITIDNTTFIQKNEMIVDSLGNLSYPEYNGTGNTNFHLPASIENDSIEFHFAAGGLGLYVSWSVTGIKK